MGTQWALLLLRKIWYFWYQPLVPLYLQATPSELHYSGLKSFEQQILQIVTNVWSDSECIWNGPISASARVTCFALLQDFDSSCWQRSGGKVCWIVTLRKIGIVCQWFPICASENHLSISCAVGALQKCFVAFCTSRWVIVPDLNRTNRMIPRRHNAFRTYKPSLYNVEVSEDPALTLANMLSRKSISVLLALFVAASEAIFNKIVLTNDGMGDRSRSWRFSVSLTVLVDGWAVAQIRAQKNALTRAGFDVCPEFATLFHYFRYWVLFYVPGHSVSARAERIRSWLSLSPCDKARRALWVRFVPDRLARSGVQPKW